MDQTNQKCVLITGVLGGIGAKTAEVFIKKKWKVIGVDNLTTPDVLPFKYIVADISKESDWKSITKIITSEGLVLTGIVNNAAIQICKPIFALDVNDWDRTMNTNVKSIFLSTKTLIDNFHPDGGAIVNVCSVHALATSPDNAAYAASKGAVLSLTRAMAIELAQRNIRVNAVLPGAVNTKMLLDGIQQKVHDNNSIENELEKLASKHLLKRVGSPDEIARGIWFLISKDSSFITGQSIVIDGGALTKLSTE